MRFFLLPAFLCFGLVCNQRTFRERKVHKQNLLSGIVPGLGGWKMFCLCVFCRAIPSGESGGEKHINNTPQKNPRTTPETFLYVLCVFVFCSQNTHALSFISGKKKSTKINFLGPETARWGGGLPREGVVAESSCPPSKVCLPWVSKRSIWDVTGILPGCPGPVGVFKKLVQTKFVCIFRSLLFAENVACPWTGKSCCRNQALVKAFLEAAKMP